MRLVLSSLFVVAAAVVAQAQTTKPPAAAPTQAANTPAPPTTGTLPSGGAQPAANKAPAGTQPVAACANANALGVGRTVEIDTTGGPGFGFQHYKVHDFLEPKEVVLTFDDGPQVNTTKAVLDALDHHCTKAIFFSIGKMALGLPEIIREVHHRGQTIGTHTWAHVATYKFKTDDEAIAEIEKGISAVHRAVGAPIAPFFRYPELKDSPATLAHLAKRNIAIFSTDID